MTKHILSAATAFGVLSLAVVAAPAHATGGAWSSVTVDQEQSSNAVGPNLHMEQRAEALTTTQLGNQAAAVSHQVASQKQGGPWALGVQQQGLESGTDIVWEKNKWPSWTTARTSGNVDQHQTIWTNDNSWSEQYALNEQASRVGRGHNAHRSTLESEASQRQDGGIGDVRQSQGISGQTSANGYTEPHFPSKFSFKGLGGTLRQFVNVTVENLISF